jgi:hypothetical protein
MHHRHAYAVLVALALVGAAATGATAATDGLAVTVEQTDAGDATVTVTSNDTAVANATVNVTVGENVSYAGVGTYATDANGTVGLPAPNRTVNVTVVAAHENETASTTAELVAANTTDGNATENETVFGQRVAAYVAQIQNRTNDTAGPLGLLVADFVTANNPSNAAGPPAWAGASENGTAATNTSERGPPEHAGPENGSDAGPPEHAGPGDETAGSTDGASESSERGPPEHAGPGNGTDAGPPDSAGSAGAAGGPPDGAGPGASGQGGGPPA